MSIHGKTSIKIILMMLVVATSLFGASVKLRLSSTEVVEGSPLTVQIVAEGKDIAFPTIDNVGGFPTEGNSVSSKLESTYINGTFSSKSVKTLRFEFYPEMDMTIPAFKVSIEGKEYQTKPIKIRVLKPSEVTATSANGYTLRIKSDKKKVFVGEPFIVTVDFFEPRNSAVTKVEYTPPKFKDFFSQALGDEKLKRSAGGTLHQLQYLVSAKKEGKLTIYPPKARVGMRSFSGADRDPWGFFANDLKWQSVRAAPLSIEAKPVPVSVDLTGHFTVTSSVDHTKVKPNTPVTYTLRISGEGSLDDIANPKFDLPGVTVYGDDAKISSKVVGNKVQSQYERKYVFISDQDFVIPSLSFKSFDYLSGKIKKIATKSHKISIDSRGASAVVPSVANSTAPRQNPAPEESKKATKEANASILEDKEYYKEQEAKQHASYALWMIVLAFVLGMLFVLLLQKIVAYIKQKTGTRKRGKYSENEALKLLYPHTNHHKKVETMVRKLYEKEGGNNAVIIDREELNRMVDEVLESTSSGV